MGCSPLVVGGLAVASRLNYHPATMGQPITAIETSSSIPGNVRFEINRNLTGMGHERYALGQPVEGDRPPDRLARRLFEHGGVDAVHIYGNVITIDLDERRDPSGLKEIVESLYIYYRPGVAVPTAEDFATSPD